MSNKQVSRREFLRLSALAAAGAVAAQYGVPAVARAASQPFERLTDTPPAAEEVTLDVVSDVPEYDNPHRQILDIFEDENPGVTINLISHSEDGQPAYAAKVAGGYCPAMETVSAISNMTRINKDNYPNYVDLSTIDYPYFDLWTYDVKNAWSNLYDGLPGPRCMNPFLGWVNTWVFHADLMEKAGLNPREEVKTWDDLLNWMDKGTQWAASADSGVDRFWDQGWLPDWFGTGITMDSIPLAFPDGQRDRQVACWKGEAAFNAPDSPYRHALEFFKQAYDKGWVNKQFWTREWETDMEAAYAAKKTVVQLHGPWIWDKAVAADPTVQQMGVPGTPPAEGQTEWMQWMGDLEIDQSPDGFTMCIRAGNEQSPHYDLVKKLFIWWHSPDIVRLRAEATGGVPAMKLDPPAQIKAPQYLGILKDIATPGGLYENVKYEMRMSGEMQMAPRRIPGSPGVWDYESGNDAKYWGDLMEGNITVQNVLDLAQKNWEASYKLD
jgi:ABC-type glycerol-3-phosphate transport system substrate-binding protein